MAVLIVDGYNVVHAWPALKRALTERGLEEARRRLVHQLAEYAAQTSTDVTVVFDAHARVETGDPVQVVDGVTVRYGTKTASADHVIERLASEAARRGDAGSVVVATGDSLQRAMVGAMGVSTMSARGLEAELARVAGDLSSASRQRRQEGDRARRVEDHIDPMTRQRLEELRRGGGRDGR